MIIEFKIEHLKDMDATHLAGMDLSAYQHVDGPAVTFIKDDKIIGCGGIHRLWSGVGEAWLILSEHSFECPITIVRQTLRNFKTMINGYHRIQANVLEGFDRGVQFVNAFGFVLEGKMEQYGPNKENYYRYVILR